MNTNRVYKKDIQERTAENLALIPWPSHKVDLKEAVLLIEEHGSLTFKPDEAIDIIKEHARLRNKKPNAHIQNLLSESLELGHADTGDFVPGFYLFQDYSFRIQPTEQEITDGVLVPGHRFLPFLSSFIGMEALSLTSGGVKFQQEEYTCTLEELEIYFELMGGNSIFSFVTPLTDEGEVSDMYFNISVYSFKEFFEKNSFRAGDQLNVRVKDYRTGTFEVTHIKKRQLLRERKRRVANDAVFSESLTSAIQTGCPMLPVKALLDAYASLKLKGARLPSPLSPPEVLFKESKELKLDHFSLINSPVIVPADVSAEEFYSRFYENMAARNDGRCESLNDLLRMGGLSLDEGLIRAYILNDLDVVKAGPESVLEGIFEGREQVEWDEDHWKLFLVFFEELIEETLENHGVYSPGEDVVTLRTKILSQIGRNLEFLRGLDAARVELSELPQQDMMKIAEIDTILSSILQLIEQSASCSGVGDVESISSDVDNLIEVWEDVAQQIKRRML